MTIWAIVPVKPLRRSKSRLASILSDEQRAALSQRLLLHTLDVLGQVPAVEHTLVVSRDSKALALAREHGARTVMERGAPELNGALARATIVARGYGVSGVLILPADLPLVQRGDVEALLACAHTPPVVVVAPDRHATGTNALVACPPGLIEYDFGVDSFERHKQRAADAGARLEICHMAPFELDVDRPEDLELLASQSAAVADSIVEGEA